MAGACSDNLSRLIKFLGESGAAFYLERDGKQLFILEFPIFNYLTSYRFSRIRTDLELMARYNDVTIAGACPPYSLCSIDVSNRVFEFDKAFVHYLSSLPEYRAVCAFTFERSPTSENRSRILTVRRLSNHERTSLSFPVQLGRALYERAPHGCTYRAPVSVLMEVMRHVNETKAELPVNHRRRVLDALHPDYRSILPEAELLSLRVALINSPEWHDTPVLGKSS